MHPCEAGCGALIDHGWNRRFCAPCRKERDRARVRAAVKRWRTRNRGPARLTKAEEQAAIAELQQGRAVTAYALRLLRVMLEPYCVTTPGQSTRPCSSEPPSLPR